MTRPSTEPAASTLVPHEQRRHLMKWFSLVLLTTQTTAMVFLLRRSRVEPVEGPRYLNTTAVFCAEVLKFCSCLVAHWFTSETTRKFFHSIWDLTGGSPLTLLTLGVPSLLYAMQNNLNYFGASRLSACVFQVTIQLKILTTSVVSVAVFGLKLGRVKWLAVWTLTAGVILVNISEHSAGGALGRHAAGKTAEAAQAWNSTIFGFAAVSAACCSSAFASVYLEVQLKAANLSIWARNIQLALLGMPLSMLIVYLVDGQRVAQDGFLQGYTPLTWAVICCQAIGGICVTMVLVYSDNIMKCFACGIAIVFTFVLSWKVSHELVPDSKSLSGILLVLIASLFYSETIGCPARGGEEKPLLGDAGAAGGCNLLGRGLVAEPEVTTQKMVLK